MNETIKKEFALSDRDVVLRIPARGMSIKYAGIHDWRMANFVENQSFPMSAKSVMIEFHYDSKSSKVSEPQTHVCSLSQNCSSSLIEGPTFSDTFSIICHMQSLWVVSGRIWAIASFMLASSSVMIRWGATPHIAFRKVLNNHSYDSIFSFAKNATPRKTLCKCWLTLVNGTKSCYTC